MRFSKACLRDIRDVSLQSRHEGVVVGGSVTPMENVRRCPWRLAGPANATLNVKRYLSQKGNTLLGKESYPNQFNLT